jgi:hypothetical protein
MSSDPTKPRAFSFLGNVGDEFGAYLTCRAVYSEISGRHYAPSCGRWNER